MEEEQNLFGLKDGNLVRKNVKLIDGKVSAHGKVGRVRSHGIVASHCQAALSSTGISI